MPHSPDFGNDLHQHPDLHLAPQLQNLSDHFLSRLKPSAFNCTSIFSRGKIQPGNAEKYSMYA
jgi:hypothetical protein